MKCAFCGKNVSAGNKVNRNETCPHCGRDLRCCVQCKFYNSHAYNECREVNAERVVDKKRANFCDYFLPRGSTQEEVNKVQDAKKALEALFKK